MQKIYISVYPNTLMVFEYLCNRANIRANRVFVSALLQNYKFCVLQIMMHHVNRYEKE